MHNRIRSNRMRGNKLTIFAGLLFKKQRGDVELKYRLDAAGIELKCPTTWRARESIK